MPHNIPHNALIVVADGAKAVLLRNTGKDNSAISLREESRLTPKNLAEEGPSGSRPEDQTPRQTDEATFGKQLAQHLFQMKERNEYSALVLVADPQTLGQMRPLLHKTVEAVLVDTLSKDLTNHSVEDIAQVLAGA